jgi:hypothetical protein
VARQRTSNATFGREPTMLLSYNERIATVLHVPVAHRSEKQGLSEFGSASESAFYQCETADSERLGYYSIFAWIGEISCFARELPQSNAITISDKMAYVN